MAFFYYSITMVQKNKYNRKTPRDIVSQRKYEERVIRDGKDLNSIQKNIIYKPLK